MLLSLPNIDYFLWFIESCLNRCTNHMIMVPHFHYFCISRNAIYYWWCIYYPLHFDPDPKIALFHVLPGYQYEFLAVHLYSIVLYPEFYLCFILYGILLSLRFLPWLGEWMNSSAGLAFTPHVLHVGVGEVCFYLEFVLYFLSGHCKIRFGLWLNSLVRYIVIHCSPWLWNLFDILSTLELYPSLFKNVGCFVSAPWSYSYKSTFYVYHITCHDKYWLLFLTGCCRKNSGICSTEAKSSMHYVC